MAELMATTFGFCLMIRGAVGPVAGVELELQVVVHEVVEALRCR